MHARGEKPTLHSKVTAIHLDISATTWESSFIEILIIFKALQAPGTVTHILQPNISDYESLGIRVMHCTIAMETTE